MKAVIAVVAVALAMLCSPAAKAWNCPSGMIRQQAPAGTPSSTPYYDVVEGIAFICETPNSSTGSSNTNSNNNTNSNTNSNSNKSSSSSSATGGSVKNSGNSNVNVKNTVTVAPKITSTNEQAQSQYQAQQQKQSISNSGNSSSEAVASGNGDNSNNTYVPQQTATAVAPIAPATVPCFKGIGVGAQGPAFGASFGGGKIDATCSALEVARSFAAMGNRVAYCKMMLSIKTVQNAGVTMDMCLAVEPKK